MKLVNVLLMKTSFYVHKVLNLAEIIAKAC